MLTAHTAKIYQSQRHDIAQLKQASIKFITNPGNMNRCDMVVHLPPLSPTKQSKQMTFQSNSEIDEALCKLRGSMIATADRWSMLELASEQFKIEMQEADFLRQGLLRVHQQTKIRFQALRNSCATRIQRFYRQWRKIVRLQEDIISSAALIMQRSLKRYVAVKRSKHKTLRGSALVIQRILRGYIVRRKINRAIKKHMEVACTKIQRRWRTSLLRIQVHNIVHERVVHRRRKVRGKFFRGYYRAKMLGKMKASESAKKATQKKTRQNALLQRRQMEIENARRSFEQRRRGAQKLSDQPTCTPRLTEFTNGLQTKGEGTSLSASLVSLTSVDEDRLLPGKLLKRLRTKSIAIQHAKRLTAPTKKEVKAKSPKSAVKTEVPAKETDSKQGDESPTTAETKAAQLLLKTMFSKIFSPSRSESQRSLTQSDPGRSGDTTSDEEESDSPRDMGSVVF